MAKVKLYNKGNRTWKFGKDFPDLAAGKSIEVDKKTADFYRERYPREFEVFGEPKKEEIAISQAVKDELKNIKGVGVKKAAQLFEEAGATTEEAQLEIVMEWKREQEEDSEE